MLPQNPLKLTSLWYLQLSNWKPSTSAERNKGSICEGRTEVKFELSYWVFHGHLPRRWGGQGRMLVSVTLSSSTSAPFPGPKPKAERENQEGINATSLPIGIVAVHRQGTTRRGGQRRIRVGSERSIHILNKTQQASFPMSSTFGQGIRVPINIFVVLLVTKSTSSSISRLITAEEQPAWAVFGATFPNGRRGSPGGCGSTAASAVEARMRPRQGNKRCHWDKTWMTRLLWW